MTLPDECSIENTPSSAVTKLAPSAKLTALAPTRKVPTESTSTGCWKKIEPMASTVPCGIRTGQSMEPESAAVVVGTSVRLAPPRQVNAAPDWMVSASAMNSESLISNETLEPVMSSSRTLVTPRVDG